MLVAYFLSFQLHEVFLLACFLVWVTLPKNDRHFLSVKDYLLALETALDKAHYQLVFGTLVLLKIDLADSFHQVYEVHEPVDFLLLHSYLLKVSFGGLLHHLLECLDLFAFKHWNAVVEIVGPQPSTHHVELLGGVLFDYELVFACFIDSETTLLV